MAMLVRCSLTNVDTGERLDAQFNPRTLRKRARAKYSRDQILYGSHEVTQWTGTRSNEIPLVLFFTRIGSADFKGSTPPGKMQQQARGVQFPTLLDTERFLDALLYPDRERGKLEPPTVIFNWPGVINIYCVVTEVEITYEHFNTFGLNPMQLSARMNIIERPKRAITSSGVRVNGALRAPLAEAAAVNIAPDKEPVTNQRHTIRDTVNADGF